MRFYCMFCIFLTIVWGKTCSANLQSGYVDTAIVEHSSLVSTIEDSVTESSVDMLTVSPNPSYSRDRSEDAGTPVSLESFGLQIGLAEIPAQTELPMNILSTSIAPDVDIDSSIAALGTASHLGIVPLHNMDSLKSQDSVMFTNKLITQSTPDNAQLASSSQPVLSEFTQTSLAGDNLSQKDNPITARMLNTSPEIIMTSPINSVKNVDKPLEIRATPTVESSRTEVPNSSKSLDSNVFSEHESAKMPNFTRPTLQANGTKSVKVEKRTNSHTMVIVPAVIGVISVLSVGFMAALYQWHQRGRRGKVYLSHPGAPPKDFAEDTGVRSPVLLPEEIEMQVGRSQSLRVRRAVILATDPPIIEADSVTVNVDSATTVVESDEPITDSTPPPPPYREPPPYLPDMVIENIHAL